MSTIPEWPKHKSGIRKGFSKRPIIQAVATKWYALGIVIRLRGRQLSNKWLENGWKDKRKEVEQQSKLRTSTLGSDEKLTLEFNGEQITFVNGRHPSGCSIQYIIMLAECIDTSREAWYESIINRYHEDTKQIGIAKSKLEKLLEKAK